MKKVNGKSFALLLCGCLLFSDLTSFYAYAENIPQSVGTDMTESEELGGHEEHNHETSDESTIIEDDDSGDSVYDQGGNTAVDQNNGDTNDQADHDAADENSDATMDGDDNDIIGPDDEIVVPQDETVDDDTLADDVTPMDIPKPEISVRKAEGGHVSSSGSFYCEPPTVTVKDEESVITSIMVSYGGLSKSVALDDADGDIHLVEFDAAEYVSGLNNSVVVTATNEAGGVATSKFYVGHTLGIRNTIIVEATCTEPKKSVMYYICSYCEETFQYFEDILAAANGHQMGEAESGSMNDGTAYVKKVCKVCGYVEITFSGGIHNHTFQDITVPATCTEEGAVYRQCTECGYRDTNPGSYKIIPVTGHRLGVFETVQDMDCITGQKKIEKRKCKNINCDYEETRTFPITHTWEKRTKKEATCSEAGESGYQCVKCDIWDRITSLPKLPHTLKDTDNDCTTPKECSVCHQKDESSVMSHVLLYASDQNGHWQECQNNNCHYSTRSGSEMHVYIDDGSNYCTESETCIVCGYVKSGEAGHNILWIKNAAAHYGVCQNENCEYQSKPEAHAGVDDDDCSTAVLCSICEYPYKAAKSHTPFGIWSWNSAGHYRYCLYCGQIVMVPHVMGEDDGDCTTPIKCQHSACGWIMVPGEAKHDFSGSWESNDNGHFRRCLNPTCNQISEIEKHTGGAATCHAPARCAECGSLYGHVNPNNHDGGTEIRGYTEPTVKAAGYSGDIYCLGCDAMIAKGETLPMLPHDHIFGSSWVYDSISHWKECEICYARSNEDVPEHVFSKWEDYETGHMRDCDICGYTETAFHVPEEDDNDCTTPLKCSVCDRTLTEATEHSFDGANYWGSETGHYRFCQNLGCHQTSPEEEHKGGNATCAARAVCEECNTPYGDLKTDNHVGREQVLGYLEPVGEIPGYTGDIYCLGCGQFKAKGQEIPPEEREHDFTIDYDGFYHWVDCSRCGQRQGGTYEKHTFGEDGRCTLEGCDAINFSLGDDHIWDVGKITKYPTCGEVGTKTYTCKQCGTLKLEEVAPTDKHTWEGDKCKLCGCVKSYYAFWVSSVEPQTYTGTAIKPEVKVYDGRILLTEKVDYTISYKNNTKVNDASEEKTAPAIVVTGKGNYSGKKTIYFPIEKKDLADMDVSIADLCATANSKVQKPVPAVTYNNKKLANNKDFKVTYPDLDAPENSNAYKAAGYYQVKIEGINNYSGERTITFRITDNALINKAKVAAIPNQTYTGWGIRPSLTVTLGGKTLEANVDYTVNYENNIQIGKAKVIITGRGDYAGRKEVTFNITGQSLAKASVTGVTNKVYNGEEQTQNIEVTLNGVQLKKDDYEISYSKNVNAGTATMTVKGKNAYTGTVKKTFKITAYDLSLDESGWVTGFPNNLIAVYAKGGSTPGVNLSFNGTPLAVNKDYTVTYSNNKKIAGVTDIKKPTVIIKGKGNFKGSKSISFTIVKRNLNAPENPVTISVPDKVYANKAGKYMSKPVLTDANGKKLVSGTDYEQTVVYTLEDGTVLNNKSIVSAGETVQVTVTGKGCYEGTMKTSYQIAPTSFGSAKITVTPRIYTGHTIVLDKNDITVKIGENTLIFGQDYEIVEQSYKNNQTKGTASVTIRGIGNYAGTKTVKFKINTKQVN